MKITGRAATATDVAVYYPGLTASFRAWVVEIDGERAGIVGVALLRPIACMFSTFEEPLRPFLRHPTVLRQVKKAQAAVHASSVPVRAVAEPDEATAPAILTRLGFTPLGEIDGDEIFEWKPR